MKVVDFAKAIKRLQEQIMSKKSKADDGFAVAMTDAWQHTQDEDVAAALCQLRRSLTT